MTPTSHLTFGQYNPFTYGMGSLAQLFNSPFYRRVIFGYMASTLSEIGVGEAWSGNGSDAPRYAEPGIYQMEHSRAGASAEPCRNHLSSPPPWETHPTLWLWFYLASDTWWSRLPINFPCRRDVVFAWFGETNASGYQIGSGAVNNCTRVIQVSRQACQCRDPDRHQNVIIRTEDGSASISKSLQDTEMK